MRQEDVKQVWIDWLKIDILVFINLTVGNFIDYLLKLLNHNT